MRMCVIFSKINVVNPILIVNDIHKTYAENLQSNILKFEEEYTANYLTIDVLLDTIHCYSISESMGLIQAMTLVKKGRKHGSISRVRESRGSILIGQRQ